MPARSRLLLKHRDDCIWVALLELASDRQPDDTCAHDSVVSNMFHAQALQSAATIRS